MKKSAWLVFLFITLSIMLFVGCDPDPDPDPGTRPIVFVHGMGGSGDQFQAQALRFASCGYPDNYFAALDHNSIMDLDRQNRLDKLIDDVLDETGADKVELVGHSMGTSISKVYLSTANNAAKVAHYVNVDGVGGNKLFGGVPTLNIMATSLAGKITGATNVHLEGHTHSGLRQTPGFRWNLQFELRQTGISL